MNFLSKLNHRKLTASSLWMPKRYQRYYHHNSSTNISFGDKAKRKQQKKQQPPPSSSSSLEAARLLTWCWCCHYFVNFQPFRCVKCSSYMMIDMHFHQFQKVCAWRKFLCTSIIAQVTTILRIFFEYKYTDDDVYEKSSNSVRCTSKFNFNVLPV